MRLLELSLLDKRRFILYIKLYILLLIFKEYVILRVEYSTKFMYAGDNIMKDGIKQGDTAILISKQNIFFNYIISVFLI